MASDPVSDRKLLILTAIANDTLSVTADHSLVKGVTVMGGFTLTPIENQQNHPTLTSVMFRVRDPSPTETA